MYGKLFAQMYDGTLATKGPWQALATFQQLIILADKHGVVDMTAEAIARRTTFPLEVIQLGIAELEKPDPYSRTPDEEGRRITRLSDSRPWGWRIVNYAHYRVLRSDDERREYHRKYWREKRSPKRKTQPASAHTQQNSTNSTNAVSSKQDAVSRKKTPTTAAGGSQGQRLKQAGELINRVRRIRASASPTNVEWPRFESEFTPQEQGIVKAAGFDLILNTPPNSQTALRWQIAEMLGARDDEGGAVA